MTRHGYTDECDDPLAAGRWQAALNRAIRGRRGQAMLRELAAALDAMPVRELYAGAFQAPTGECCALGVLGAARGIDTSDLGTADEGVEFDVVAARFGIAEALAREVMFRNDGIVDDSRLVEVEICGPMRGYNFQWQQRRPWPEHHRRWVRVPIPDAPARRWRSVREWVATQLGEVARNG